MIATLTSKGQLTLPKAIRDELRLGAGSQIDFSLRPDGTISARPLKRSVDSIVGLLYRAGRPAASLEQLEQARDRFLADKHERIRLTGTSAAAEAPARPKRRR